MVYVKYSKYKGVYTALVVMLLFSAFIACSGIFYITLPWKVIDPSDPEFNPQKFDFRDYSPAEFKTIFDQCDELKKVVKVGMGKAENDRILVGSAG